MRSHGVVVVAVSALVLVASLAGSGGARARSNGIVGASGKSTTSCRTCHGAQGPAPTVSLVGLAARYAVGATASFTLRVQRAGGSSGVRAGFGLSTTSAGRFVPVSGEQTQTGTSGTDVDNELTHGPSVAGDPGPQDFDGAGRAEWQVSLADLAEGRHTIFAGVVDGNGIGSANDRTALTAALLVVCDDAAADVDGDGLPGLCDGCPDDFDPAQPDVDGDRVGDACDNCPAIANRDQRDSNQNGLGDVCDPDTDECALGLDNCSPFAVCTDAPDGFSCSCPAGFVGDGILCDDVDECAQALDDCAPDARCANTPPGSFTCTCNAGFVGDGRVCVVDPGEGEGEGEGDGAGEGEGDAIGEGEGEGIGAEGEGDGGDDVVDGGCGCGSSTSGAGLLAVIAGAAVRRRAPRAVGWR